MTGPSRGTRRTHVVVLVVLALTTALAVVGALPVAGAVADSRSTSTSGPISPISTAGAPRAGDAARPEVAKAGGTRTKRVTLAWKGAPRAKRYSRQIGVPQIGTLGLTCRPNAVQLSLKANQRDNETQLWLAKYEDKSYGQAVAVKTVRIFRFANANDDGTGGTSNPQHEGLNQRGGKNGVENYGKGYGHGIISQRAGRNDAVGGAALRPVTTFEVSWYWNGFDYPAKYRSCKIDIVMVTQLDQRLGVNWHGDDDAEGNTFQQVRIPGLGYLQLTCEPGRYGAQVVSLVPDDARTRAYLEIVEGEGRIEDQVETRNRVTDPDTGTIGPIQIPTNGMMRLYFTTPETTVPFIVSSYQKINDTRGNLNTCEIAMGRFPR